MRHAENNDGACFSSVHFRSHRRTAARSSGIGQAFLNKVPKPGEKWNSRGKEGIMCWGRQVRTHEAGRGSKAARRADGKHQSRKEGGRWASGGEGTLPSGKSSGSLLVLSVKGRDETNHTGDKGGMTALARFLTHSDDFFSHSLARSSKLDSPSSLGLVPHCFLRHLEFPHLPLLALHRPSTGFSSLFRLAPPQSLGLSPVGSELLEQEASEEEAANGDET